MSSTRIRSEKTPRRKEANMPPRRIARCSPSRSARSSLGHLLRHTTAHLPSTTKLPHPHPHPLLVSGKRNSIWRKWDSHILTCPLNGKCTSRIGTRSEWFGVCVPVHGLGIISFWGSRLLSTSEVFLFGSSLGALAAAFFFLLTGHCNNYVYGRRIEYPTYVLVSNAAQISLRFQLSSLFDLSRGFLSPGFIHITSRLRTTKKTTKSNKLIQKP